jgi:hypothetical protein
MRWILFLSVQITALGAIVAEVIHGPSLWSSMPAGTLLWLARRLFGPGQIAGPGDWRRRDPNG